MNATTTTNAAADATNAKPATPDQAKAAAKPQAAAKPAKPAKKESAKPAAKKGASKAAAKKTSSGKGAAFFIAANRPASGALLHAHTEAFFTIYGMHKGKGAPVSIARAVMGATALNYHKGNGRFEVRDGQVFMTEAGKIQFGARVPSIDAAAVAAFVSVMTTGKPDGQYVKAAGAIAAIAA